MDCIALRADTHTLSALVWKAKRTPHAGNAVDIDDANPKH
jgi:hypothetical protein